MKQLVVFGLTITSSWGNGHATTYRSLLAGLHRRGWRVLFYERDAPWYAANRDWSTCEFAEIRMYRQWKEVRTEALRAVERSQAALVGSYCPDGAVILDDLLQRRQADGPVVAFYDIDTPVTLEYLQHRGCDYLRVEQIPCVDLYLSFTAGPMLSHLERHWGARRARALHCSCDPELYCPGAAERQWELGYMGTYAADRQGKLERLVLAPARRLPGLRFAVAGPMYPPQTWPANVVRKEHLAPGEHADFYRACRLCMNLTRQAMVAWGYSPSIRLFEAAACGAPIVTDPWPGLSAFFRPGQEIFLAAGTEEMISLLADTGEAEAARVGAAGRQRVLQEHSGEHRAQQLESYLAECD